MVTQANEYVSLPVTQKRFAEFRGDAPQVVEATPAKINVQIGTFELVVEGGPLASLLQDIKTLAIDGKPLPNVRSIAITGSVYEPWKVLLEFFPEGK